MNRYTIYIEGLNREVVIGAATEKAARDQAWNNLTDSERDAVVQMEVIEEEPINLFATQRSV